MNIICPHCNFSKPVDPAKIPDRPVKVNCPKCHEMFTFSCSGEKLKVESPGADSRGTNREELRRKLVAVSPADRPKAGFWHRSVAFLIDSFLLLIIQLLLNVLLSFSINMVVSSAGHPATGVVILMFGLTVTFSYFIFFTAYCGQTPGKMALRIKVVNSNGELATYGQAVLRELLGKTLSSFLAIGFLMVAFTRDKQGLHDKIAKTYVLKL